MDQKVIILFKLWPWDFPGDPVVKTDSVPPLQGAAGSIPGQETKILDAAQRGQNSNNNK